MNESEASKEITLIAAVSENNALGKNNQLIWHLSEDLKRFKRLTQGHSIIMGRKTWDSIGKPLPGRASIVLTKSLTWKAEGAIVANSFESAIIKANSWIEINKKIVLITGIEKITEAKPVITRAQTAK